MTRPTSGRHAPARLARAGAAVVLAAAVAAGVAAASSAAAEKRLPHVTGSRATFIHRLPLLDTEKKPVRLADDPVLPFSYRTTCDKCHEYARIRTGWHFNAADASVDPGRPGQPWFWCDPKTGTQIPLSYRAWPNTWRPGDLGMTPWMFCLTFGHHLPGGGPGEMTQVKDPGARWLVSGKLEVNCGACHSGDPTYDNIEWYLQIAGQNFMWAGAACTDLASVTGAAAGMPPSYDPFMGPDDEVAAKRAPAIAYAKTRFDSKGRAFFDLPSSPPDARCYFCHTSTNVGSGAPEPWKTDEDIHTRAGLACASCHRSGLDHVTTRNYEGEPAAKADPHLATLTCRGCHLGDESAAAGPNTMGGRLGARVPLHVGLPTIHLEKLACTTCHSGPYPGKRTGRVQTSMAHLIEFQGPHRGPDAMPYIAEPVFARRPYDGTIGPQRMAWPSFWARIDGDTVTPLSPDTAYQMAKDAFTMEIPEETAGETPLPEPAAAEPATDAPSAAEKPGAPAEATKPAAAPSPDKADADPDAEPGAKGEAGDEDLDDPAAAPAKDKKAGAAPEAPPAPAAEEPAKPVRRLSEKRIATVLAMLKAKDEKKGEFGYVCQGRLYRAAAEGTLVSVEHPAAQPVAWPIAHNVRAAGQSLGTGGCTDCHSGDSPVAFGEVVVDSPARLGPPVVKAMYEFQGRDPMELWAWSMSYKFRPMFKVVGFATAGLIGAVLALYGLLGLAALARWAGKKAPPGPTS